MPTNMTTSIHTTPIKWTDDEWKKIVVQLYQLKGNRALASDGVEDIKARDVFEAQNVLPIERRRKQISIAQGFQQIRVRLRGLFERGQQEDLFSTPVPKQTKAAYESMSPVVPLASTDVPKEELDSFRAADWEAEAHATNEAVEQRLDEVPQSATSVPTTPAPAHASVQSFVAAADEGKQASTLAEQPSSSLVEVARPFVAMVCEELARALVQTFSRQEYLSSLTPRLQPSAGVFASPFGEAQFQPNAYRSSNERPSRRTSEDPRAGRLDAIQTEDDEVGQPVEVQPLFDPKLPPSANSDFKPMIGLVTTRDHEYEDLHLLYPQLRFSIVSAEDIHGPEVFQNCQRVIGLREEVPQAVEELLKRALGYRYIWLRGGIDRVREQLDTWLANPSSMQPRPRSTAPRVDKEVRKGSGKKRTKWPPRIA